MRSALTTFKDRSEAGHKLAEALLKYRDEFVVVYALPRGGVPVAAQVAKSLQAPLDVLTARKIGLPEFPEFAIAAVAQNGEVVENPEAVSSIDRERFEKLVEAEHLEAQARYELYTKGRKSPEIKGKTAIIVDDGLATGLTVRAAIRDLRRRRPARIVVAVPVAPDIAREALSREVDEFICLRYDPHFVAVGAYYDDFPQVTNEEVIKCLEENAVLQEKALA